MSLLSKGGNWSQQAYLKASRVGANDNFGIAVDVFMDSIIIGAYKEQSLVTGVNGNELDNTLTSSGAAYIFTRNNNNWNLQAYLKASNTDDLDFFGSSVSLQYDIFIATSPFENSNATGLNGDDQNNSLMAAGATYMYSFQALPDLMFGDGFEE